jgi:tripartite-type tricarboxylate transporter receptor subunit TctC
VQSIYSAVAKHISQASVRTRLEGSGLEIFLLDPAGFLAFMREQRSDMAKVIKAAGIKLEQ